MKKYLIASILLLSMCVAQAATITDDFNRADLDYTNDCSLIGAGWTQDVAANKWQLNGGKVYANPGIKPAVMYNTGLETESGGGAAFTFSMEHTPRLDNLWSGVVFNYQNPSNFYILRLKTSSTSYQLLSSVDGVLGILKSATDATTNFVKQVAYTLTVSSDAAYEFDFSIAQGGTVIASGNSVVDAAENFTGGYAGTYVDAVGGAPAKYDDFSLEATPPLPRSSLFVAIRSKQPAVSNLKATMRSGQVFLTWKEAPVSEGTTFRVFLHDQPITDETLPQATQVGQSIEAGSACDWWKDPASFDANATPNRTHGFVIDGKELDPRDGLFVHTITEADPPTMYFAVLPSSSDTVLDSVAVQGAPAFPEPIQLQNAPASNSAAGGSLTLDLHGRGGGTDADNQANFLLFGDSLQGWREGLARKFVVESDGGNIVIKPLDRMWVNRPLLYSWDVRDHVPAINTWWYGCNDHIYDPQGVTNGVVVNYTEEHLLYLVRWAQRYFGTDPQRTYIKGTSMGGSGAISMGFHHPDVFASIFSAVPVVAYTRRAGADGRYNLLRLDGLCGRPCDETVMSSEGIPVMERMDGERIAREYSGDLPFLVLCNGRTDKSIPWINNPFFYQELNRSRRGFSSYWNNGAHDMLASVPADVTEFYAAQPMELNASYPAFSNFSDNRDPGDGARDDGDITGWMNRDFIGPTWKKRRIRGASGFTPMEIF